MPRSKQPGKRVSSAKPATSHQAAAACRKVLAPLSGYIDIGLQKRSGGKPDPTLLAEIHDTVMEMYRSLMQNLPSR